MSLQAFDKWDIEFVGLINPLGKNTSGHYIITKTDYVTRWAEAKTVKDCTADTATCFIFEHILTRFGYTRISMNDGGTHFVNETIESLTK